tara:strand:+ start:25526 stop:25954 length:429 start_codon:yes stop_codon:yes gene_type:complete
MIKAQEESLLDLLSNSGLLTSFVDRDGVTQDAPPVQLYEFNEDELADTDRCLVIKNTGNGVGNYLLRTPSVSIMAFSRARKGDISYPRDYIERIKDYISTNFRIDCIISANIIGDVAGPYRLQSGRRYFELNLNVITDTGEV